MGVWDKCEWGRGRGVHECKLLMANQGGWNSRTGNLRVRLGQITSFPSDDEAGN